MRVGRSGRSDKFQTCLTLGNCDESSRRYRCHAVILVQRARGHIDDPKMRDLRAILGVPPDDHSCVCPFYEHGRVRDRQERKSVASFVSDSIELSSHINI